MYKMLWHLLSTESEICKLNEKKNRKRAGIRKKIEEITQYIKMIRKPSVMPVMYNQLNSKVKNIQVYYAFHHKIIIFIFRL